MVSVLVLGFESATGRPPTLSDSVRTLGALVSGAVDGVVRDVTLLATEPGTELAKVADHAGCGFIVGRDVAELLKMGAAQARCDHLLILLAGVSFDRALSDEIAVQASRAGATSPGLRVRAAASGALGRILPGLAPTIGLLTGRATLDGTGATGFAALLRALHLKRSFKTRAWSGAL